MATTTPFRELILQDVVTVLKTIKTSNDFRTQVKDEHISRELTDKELDFSDLPALWVSDGQERPTEGTNREVFSNFNIIIAGQVRYNKDDKINNIASVQLNKLIADVKEVIMDTTTVLWTSGNATNVHIDDVQTDEGKLDPDAFFQIILRIEYEYSHNDAGRKIQT